MTDPDLVLAGVLLAAALVALGDPRRLLAAVATLGALLAATGLLLGMVGL